MSKEFREMKIPDEILSKMEKAAEMGQPLRFGEAGVFDWLTTLSANENWYPVWPMSVWPYVVFEREVQKS